MRIIDGDALINEFDKTFLGNNPRGVIRATIENAPTIEPERKKGKWLPVEMDGVCYYRCDKCEIPAHRNTLFDSKYNFCPNCGSDMRGEE